MKNDINLLHKRKTKHYSPRTLVVTLIAIFFVAGGLFAAILLPSEARVAAKLDGINLDNQLINFKDTEKQLKEKNETEDQLTQQLDMLKKLSEVKGTPLKYLEAVEKSLPVSASVTSLSLENTTLSITGIAGSDDIIATFCTRLRDTKLFSSVLLKNSMLSSAGESTTFAIEATLNATMNNTTALKSQLEAAATAKASAAPTKEAAK